MKLNGEPKKEDLKMPKSKEEEKKEWDQLMEKSKREKLSEQEIFRMQFLHQKHSFTHGFFD